MIKLENFDIDVVRMNKASLIVEIKKTELEEPRHGYNVFVKHTIHHQDFWTRGFLMGNEWEVMTWSGKVKVPKSDIKEWMPIMGISYF